MPDRVESTVGGAATNGSPVRLRAGASEVAIAPNRGGSIAWYRTSQGQRCIDWLRPASANALARAQSDGMGCFPLVPFSNRVRDGRFRFGGRDVQLPLNVPGQPHAVHGHGWQAAWNVTAQTDNAATIEYRHPGGAWPFAYTARQTFRLGEHRLGVEIGVENHSDVAMPLGLGLHPYFPRTRLTRLSAGVAKMWATDDEIMPTSLIALPQDRQLDQGVMVDSVAMDNGFAGWDRRARIEWPELNAALVMTATPPLTFLVVYAPPDEPYFCAEPVSHCTDAFNLAAQGRRDTGLIVLAPGRSIGACVYFTPEIMNI